MTHFQVGQKRVGVFGGSFDPPHVAHVALVKAALSGLNLDELRLVPTGHAWYKERALSSATHRLAMCQLTFEHIPKVVVDSREISRLGPSYTVDTLHEISSEFPGDAIFLIIGGDQARSLESWHDWREILRLAIICVAERKDLTGGNPIFSAPIGLESRFRSLHFPHMPVSATDVRSRIAKQHSVDTLVFEPVARYIDEHHLYQTI